MTDKKKLIIGSRGSKLSLAYANHVKSLLIKSNSQFDDNLIEIKIIKTSGDIFQNKRISDIGGKGVFCKQIEEELLESKIDLAVHSLKDLPTVMTGGLCVNALVKRNDPRDAFLSYSNQSFNELKPQSKIGTSSFRRHAQLKFLRDDLSIIPMRGNIDTRINKLNNDFYDAIILSYAGIQFLSLKKKISQIFSTSKMIPSAGQGVIALQCRKNDKEIIQLLNKVNHNITSKCIKAERSVLRVLEGDCETAVGAFAKIEENKIILEAELFSLDGNERFYKKLSKDIKFPEELGKEVGEILKKKSKNLYKK